MTKLLAHNDQGQGKVIVLLHGFCENRTMWHTLVPYLTPTHRVVTIDLGGFGESTHLLPNKVTMDTLAAQVLELLQALSIASCVIIGHSLGGYIALAMAVQQPGLLTGLGLVHSSALKDSKARQAIRNRIVTIVKQRGAAPFANHFVQALFPPDRLDELAEVVNECKTMALHTPPRSIIEVTLAMKERPDRSQLLQELTCPVMFLIGKQDQAITFDQYLPQITLPQDAHVHLLEHTAHMGIWERPQKTRLIVQNFVNYCTNYQSIVDSRPSTMD